MIVSPDCRVWSSSKVHSALNEYNSSLALLVTLVYDLEQTLFQSYLLPCHLLLDLLDDVG